MDSVMDDNRLLTLASNKRIQLKPSMRLVFELRDLRFASPATVSRAGIVFITEGKQWNSFVQSWIDKREDTPERKAILSGLFNHYVPETLKDLKKNFQHLTPTFDFNLVQSLCFILDGLLTPEIIPKTSQDDKRLFETYFVFLHPPSRQRVPRLAHGGAHLLHRAGQVRGVAGARERASVRGPAGVARGHDGVPEARQGRRQEVLQGLGHVAVVPRHAHHLSRGNVPDIANKPATGAQNNVLLNHIPASPYPTMLMLVHAAFQRVHTDELRP
mmetsp:Transcript_35086/g.75905  ORF Transcript_35086/g.75905 Transcript_35086/m.75905 type:complete len:272 (-) Transcript_35086:25-840(-)